MNTQGLRLLMVDDSEDDYLLARDMLSEICGDSMELEWAASYEEGLKAIEGGGHDACLLDYHLGGRDGLELLERAIRLGWDAPIIVLTGQGNQEVDLEAMQLGAAGYLVKGSIDASLLERCIRYAVESKRAENELAELTGELKEALASVKTLEGLLPICAQCKNVRDDDGRWNQIESYISRRAGTSFSHSVCPQCMVKLYPDIPESGVSE